MTTDVQQSNTNAEDSEVIETEQRIETVVFGTYYQDAEGQEKSPIEWIVLEEDEKSKLLLSKQILDSREWSEQSHFCKHNNGMVSIFFTINTKRIFYVIIRLKV